MLRTSGIHHITAIVNDPQVNYDFYTKILGLRLVKKTVNFDKPEVITYILATKQRILGRLLHSFHGQSFAKGA